MTTRVLGVLVAFFLLAVGPARAQPFPIFDGDPVDGLGRAHVVLPGVPLILPQPDGKFDPPIVDLTVIGDVDLVVRAGDLSVGAVMPSPVSQPPIAVAGGPRFGGGAAIPFTVIASDGDPSREAGRPLLGFELDGIPVMVFAFADLDGDGFVGPTNDDSAGASDNGRERQESEFPVGRQVAIFAGGVARGSLVVDTGAPATAGGLSVVLTAAAYVGPFSPDFFLGTVPDGPGVATLLPFFPRLDPDRVVDAEGRGGPASPSVRISVELESEFDSPVDDPVLGTPFALPTDGSSPTIDRAIVHGGAASRARFVRPTVATAFTGDEDRLGLKPALGGVLVEAQEAVQVTDDGPGAGVSVQLVPADTLDDVTDPATPLAVTLHGRDGAVIGSPDTDGDSSQETVMLGSGAGVVVTVDDAGGVNDQTGPGTIVATVDGAPVATLTVAFLPGVGGGDPRMLAAGLSDDPPALVQGCPVVRTLWAVADGTIPIAISAEVDLDGTPLQTIPLLPGALPPGVTAPAGTTFTAPFDVQIPATGLLSIRLVATDGTGGSSAPLIVSRPVVDHAPPLIRDVQVEPNPAVLFRNRATLTVSARVTDDCGIHRVRALLDRGKGLRRFGRLRDKGRKGDAVAGDGVFTKRRRRKLGDVTTVTVQVEASNVRRQEALSAPVVVSVVP